MRLVCTARRYRTGKFAKGVVGTERIDELGIVTLARDISRCRHNSDNYVSLEVVK